MRALVKTALLFGAHSGGLGFLETPMSARPEAPETSAELMGWGSAGQDLPAPPLTPPADASQAKSSLDQSRPIYIYIYAYACTCVYIYV